MRQFETSITLHDVLAELTQTVKKSDHGHVEASVLQQSRNGKVARAVPVKQRQSMSHDSANPPHNSYTALSPPSFSIREKEPTGTRR